MRSREQPDPRGWKAALWGQGLGVGERFPESACQFRKMKTISGDEQWWCSHDMNGLKNGYAGEAHVCVLYNFNKKDVTGMADENSQHRCWKEKCNQLLAGLRHP